MPQIGVKAGQADRPRRRAVRGSGGSSVGRAISSTSRHAGRNPLSYSGRRHRTPSAATSGFNGASSVAKMIGHHPSSRTFGYGGRHSYTPRSSSPRASGGASHRYQRTERRYDKTRQNYATTNALASMFVGAGNIVRYVDPKLVHGYHATVDPIAARDYRRYSQDLWQQAKRYYPQHPGEQPTAKIQSMPGAAGITTFTRSGPKVAYSPDTAAGWEMTKDGPVRRYIEQVPLHEWAHYGQGLTGTIRGLPKSLSEGGAEALRQYVARRLGYPKVPSASKEYAQFTSDARRLGLGWVLRGQFTPKS